MSAAGEYLNVYTAGLFFLFLYNISTGVFTALGDSKTPLYFLIASSLGNIALDLVFVINFKMGVQALRGRPLSRRELRRCWRFLC